METLAIPQGCSETHGRKLGVELGGTAKTTLADQTIE